MKKILVVEDEVPYAQLLRDALAPKYKVICAYNGVDGLAAAKKERPDLILLDIRMPGMDGMSVLKELRKDSYGRTAKVIILTNFEATDDMLMQVAQDLPTYYFIKSNVQLFDLLEKIDDILRA